MSDQKMPSQETDENLAERRITFSLPLDLNKTDLVERSKTAGARSLSGYISSLVQRDFEIAEKENKLQNLSGSELDFYQHSLKGNRDHLATETSALLDRVSEKGERLEIGEPLKKLTIKCLQEAIIDYVALDLRDGNLFGNIETQQGRNWRAVKFGYPTSKDHTRLQDSLEEILWGLDAELGSQTIAPPKTESRATHMVAEGAACRFKIFYLFPFTRDLIRRQLWGVIPYGEFSEIGIVIHRNLASNLGNLDDQAVWFRRLVNYVRDQEGGAKILSRDGYIEGEIFEFLWHATSTDDVGQFQALFDRTRSGKSISNLDQLREEVALTDLDIVVVDLGDSVARGIRDESNWNLIPIQHDYPVPVGLGFTLSLLPHLLYADCWMELAKKMSDLLSSDSSDVGEFTNNLTRSGIRIVS